MNEHANTVKHSQVFNLPVAPERAFAALTNEADLKKWFAEHVKIEPRAGGKFLFWGTRTPWVPRESDADGVITKFDAPRQLSFKWTLRGCASQTDLLLAPDGDVTELMVRQASVGKLWPQEAEAPWVLADFWKVMIGNLRHYLATGAPAIAVDFSSRNPTVLLSIEIDAPPEKVWAALTDPAKMNQWLSNDAVVEHVVGGKFSYGWTDKSGSPVGPSTVVDLVPNRLLEHDWQYTTESRTRVRWQLQSLSTGGTRVTLTHTKFEDPTVNGGYVQGWAAFLVELRQFVERA